MDIKDFMGSPGERLSRDDIFGRLPRPERFPSGDWHSWEKKDHGILGRGYEYIVGDDASSSAGFPKPATLGDIKRIAEEMESMKKLKIWAEEWDKTPKTSPASEKPTPPSPGSDKPVTQGELVGSW